jgi:cyclomaltodextrinase / maltogenic alpha-amylase / neopullulanase
MRGRHTCAARGLVCGGALLAVVLLPGCAGANSRTSVGDRQSSASIHDQQRAAVLAARAADWRNGAIVYQVIVDRFAPATNLEAKRALYPPPKRLRQWSEAPTGGAYVPEAGVYQHEIDFWGGDLASLRGKLDYVHKLGADVLYLNPIHRAYTNHKYDASDYFAVSEEYGTRADVQALAADCHTRKMRLVLDGVFNHMGRRSPWFTDALRSPDSPYRDWFFIGPEYRLGYRAWFDVPNLPELRLENLAVQARIFGAPDSVVQGYLRDGVDGWRLDVAFDMGPEILRRLTEGAHDAKPDSVVVGEIWNYPAEWFPAIDGIMNFNFRAVIFALVRGETSGAQAGRMIASVIADAGLDPILKSWIILDNHDTARLKTELPQSAARHMAQMLQFTLPGCPCVYYGVELGMEGGYDPAQRGPMRWDEVRDDNAELTWMRQLIALRRDSRALRIGDFRALEAERLLAFMRRTERVAETTIVVVNPTNEPVTEMLAVPESKFMNHTELRDALSGTISRVSSGTLRVEVPPETVWILQPVIKPTGEYSSYKRVQ